MHVSRLSRTMRRKEHVNLLLATGSNKKIFRHKRLEFWAERGLCHIIHRDTGQYECVSYLELLRRASFFTTGSERSAWSDARVDNQRTAESMIRCAKMAKAQGSPEDVGIFSGKQNGVPTPPRPQRVNVVCGNE